MRDYINRLRAHPEHIRHRIAIGTTVGVTALVALVWIVGLTSSGTLALDLNSPTSVGGAYDSQAVAQTKPKNNLDQLLGAIGALHKNNSNQLDAVVATSSDTTDAQQPQETATVGSNMNATQQTSIQF